MKKIKVLHFPIGNMGGGITRYALETWRFIDRTKFQFDFATMLPNTLPVEDALNKEGCQVFHIRHYAEDDEAGFYNSFHNILEQGRYDVVHLHTRYWKSLAAEQAAKDMGIPKIIIYAQNSQVGSTLGSVPPLNELKRHEMIRDAITTDIATDFWACSHVAANFLYGKRIPREHIKIMPPVIDLESFTYSAAGRDYIRKKYNLSDKDFVVGNIGRFVYQKNQEFLIRVLKKINEQHYRIKLMLVGSGENASKYHKMVDDYKLNGNVLFTGFVTDEDRTRIFSALDLFVMSSRYEGLPAVLIEAQAAGLRCLVSDQVTKEARATDDVNYLPLDEERWAEAIVAASKKYVPHRDTSRQLTDAGYNIRKQIKEVEKAYRGEL